MIPLFKVNMHESAKTEVCDVLMSGMITQGKKVEEYEARLRDYFNHPYVLSLNSATSGLVLAYMLHKLSVDDEVISTPLTCFATTSAILTNKCKIVWADVDKKTCNIDVDNLTHLISPRTRALCFVHWAGTPVNVDKVEEIKQYTREKYGNELVVIEDCAHAFGSEWKGKKLGVGYGNIAVYSTQAIKHLTTGDGGIIILPNEELYKQAKLLRWYGIDRERRSLPGADFRLEPDIWQAGGKYHMNDINATIGLCNMSSAIENVNKHKENADYYNKHIVDSDIIEKLQPETAGDSSYWVYTLRVKRGLKQAFTDYMIKNDVMVSQVHARNDKHSCVSNFARDLPVLDSLEKEIISIPVGWWLTNAVRSHIVTLINGFYTPRVEKLKDYNTYVSLLRELNGYTDDRKSGEQAEIPDAVYCLKINENVVSMGKLWIEKKLYDNVAHIEDVVTASEFRGRGYGKLLVSKLREISMQNGCYKAVLNCKPELQYFYVACGFSNETVGMVARFPTV